ncbi:type 4 prepilin-like proteins leader peptide-processing enzyme [Desulfosarcina ovata subsp. sediminis]|uniref:Prepilin leader peptidase/N-methyltransferase n=1 Tax=Desulfosarcina ovata subsp. sediminis TaxID=885957 RepID=A0A5K7ZQI3_9BACT|nr:A24 family peptidase [Desulfosarcina ovata]BBO79583.1 type 4 prepilin-like proteins leader peptide-processing enzyme [Desulfosarcina ovata subsp. sediminis]
MISPFAFDLIAFIFGACIGSFLNVCIYRIPAGLSIVYPGSTCPRCKTAIPFYDNIPIVSYLVLGRKCRTCKLPIAVRYPFVELLGGLFALACVRVFGPTLHGLVVFAFIAILIVISFIDLDHRIIPDVISLPGIPLFFVAAFAVPAVTWQARAIGILAGGGSLLAVAWGYHLFTGREGMGGGDIKLLAMIGAMIGWQGILFTLFAASAIGTLAGILAMLKSGKGMKLAIPFGPFLATGATLYIFFGDTLIEWYFHFL